MSNLRQTRENNLPSSSRKHDHKWIRGVNLGGWLVIERYIVPYQFAITDCHLADNLCWYPDQLSAPKDATLCDFSKCSPARNESIFGYPDYPVDEWNLAAAFPNRTTAERWFNTHFENFITRDDLVLMKNAGLTHLRVPLPHWLFGNIASNEPWIPGDRWKYFLRMCQWARDIGLEVWPSLHTAPGSQNGFDNSGIENIVYTCGGWGDSQHNIQRTLDIIDEITRHFAEEKLLDVVTGFGILNEPFFDCKLEPYQMFVEDAFIITRRNMGQDINVFVSDKFASKFFNDGVWWLDPQRYHNTFLDTHFYQVFDPELRGSNPKEHIARLCDPKEGDDESRMETCCYVDAPNNTIPSKGVQRISTEWSAAFDSMPGELLQDVMQGIYNNSKAPAFDRVMSPERKAFLKQFVQAQIVSFEAADSGVSSGWFYWTIKTEGGAFAEWDFSRGYKEGWIPEIAKPDIASQDVYGRCNEIRDATTENMDLVHAYPWGDEPYWTKEQWKNFVVTSHNVSHPVTDNIPAPEATDDNAGAIGQRFDDKWDLITSMILAVIILAVYLGVRCIRSSRKWQYASIDDAEK